MSDADYASPGTADPTIETNFAPGGIPIPIVVLPGIMGTRLMDAQTRKLTWNPRGYLVNKNNPRADPGRLRVSTRLLDPDRVMEPAGDERWPSTHKASAAADHIQGFYELLPSTYKELLFALKFELAKLFPAYAPRVYACGYDWRHSNAMSARRLAKAIRRAREDCGGKQVVVVAHSMGGIVARYLSAVTSEDAIRAIFLLGSPTLGAIQGYRVLKDGFAGLGSPAQLIVKALGQAAFRKLPSAYQLLPTLIYANKVNQQWLLFDPSETGYKPVLQPTENGPVKQPYLQFADCTSSRLYWDVYTGFTDTPDKGKNRRRRDDAPFGVLGNLHEMTRFHAKLADTQGARTYVHPRTHFLYSDGYETMVGGGIDLIGVYVEQGAWVGSKTHPVKPTLQELAGDGTVPTASASPRASAIHAGGSRLDIKRLQVHSQHEAIVKDPGVHQYLAREIVALYPAHPYR